MKNTASSLKTTTLVVITSLLSLLPLNASAYTFVPSGLAQEGSELPQYTAVSGVLKGEAFNVNWSFDQSSDYPVLDAKAIVKVVNLTATQLELRVNLKNITSKLIGDNEVALRATLSNFGLDVKGFTSGSLSKPGTNLKTFALGSPSGIPHQFCATNNTNCAVATHTGGLQMGKSNTFTFLINGAFDPNTGVDLTNFGTMWKTNYTSIVLGLPNANNFALLSGTISEAEIPEPSMNYSLILLGVGLFIKVGSKLNKTRSILPN